MQFLMFLLRRLLTSDDDAGAGPREETVEWVKFFLFTRSPTTLNTNQYIFFIFYYTSYSMALLFCQPPFISYPALTTSKIIYWSKQQKIYCVDNVWNHILKQTSENLLRLCHSHKHNHLICKPLLCIITQNSLSASRRLNFIVTPACSDNRYNNPLNSEGIKR